MHARPECTRGRQPVAVLFISRCFKAPQVYLQVVSGESARSQRGVSQWTGPLFWRTPRF